MTIVRLNNMPSPNRVVVPAEASSLNINKIVETMGLAVPHAAGHMMRGPLLAKIEENVIQFGRSILDDYGFLNLEIPTLNRRELVEKSGKLDEFRDEFYHLAAPNNGLIVTGTTEEPVIDFVAPGLQSYRQLPMRFCHVHSVQRNCARPEGLYKTRDIRCIVLTTFDADETAYRRTVDIFEDVCQRFFHGLNIKAFPVREPTTQAIEFLAESELGDRTIDKSVVRRFGSGVVEHDADNDGKKYASMSMGYVFPQTHKFDIHFHSRSGSQQQPIVGTFGIGLTRTLLAMMEHSKNGATGAFTKTARPFDVTLVQAGRITSADEDKISSLAQDFHRAGLRVAIDDRSLSVQKKFELARFFSCPVQIICGKNEFLNDAHRASADTSATAVTLSRRELMRFAQVHALT